MIINTINTSGCQPQTIVIGRRGTYDTMQIAFDLSYLVESFGNGVAVLAVKRSQDESAYPAVTTQEDDLLLWTVSETDTYYIGAGECQLMWYVDGGLAKTIIYPMVVMRDILATSEDAPDAYQTWVDDLTTLGAETLRNAQNAAQSESDAEDAKVNAVTAKEAAEAAQEAAETAVTHYPTIQNNYWMVWDSATQQYVSTGIQAEGEDGYSPEVTIESITGGHRVTITDKDHPQGQSFDVMDGQGGGGTSDYTDLTNKPQINGHTLSGNQTAAQLGLVTPSDIPTVPVQSVAGKTGAVTLNANDVAFSESGTYDTGTVGAELSQQKNAISQNKESISDTQSMIATVEATATASKNYSVGDLLVYDGKLYEVTSAIATGATIIVGSNVAQTTVETQIASASGGGSDWTSAEVTVSEEVTSVLFDVPLTAKEVYLEYEILRTTTTSNFIWVGSDFGDNNTAANRIQVPADSVHCIGACNITIGYSFISSYCVNGTRTSVPTGLVSASSGQFWASSGAKGSFTRTGKIGVSLSTGIAAGSKISLRYR